MNRRALLKALPAAAVAGAVPAVVVKAAAQDPMIRLCEQYIEAFHAWENATEEPGEGGFDGPLTTAIGAEKDRLLDLIKETPIETDAGFAAFCRFIAVDNFISGSGDWPDMHLWQWNKIHAWAEARALVGSAA